jgi:threonine/homoserine/homoserine lactone efflux protein
MMYAVWTGIILGTTLALAAGPAMFALVQTSIKEGFKKAMLLEIGVLLSDAFCIGIIIYTVGDFLESQPLVQRLILFIGGILLITLGALRLFARFSQKNFRKQQISPKTSSVWALISKGFFYNTLNPSVILFWLGIVSIVSSKFEGSQTQIMVHFGSVLSTLFFWDALKAWFAGKIRGWMSPRRFIYLNKAVGVLFIFFGGFLLGKMVWSWIVSN